MKIRHLIAIAAAMAVIAPLAVADGPYDWIQEYAESANQALADSGSDLRIAYAEILTDSHEQGQTLFFFNVGNKQLAFDFVPGDPRRSWNPGTGITYLVDLSEGSTLSGLTAAQTTAAIDSAMATWDFATECSNVPMISVPDSGADPDLIDFIFGFGPPPGPGWPFADMVHAGWVTAFPPPILGVTFTFGFTSGGMFTDINNDGKLDAAFREIYYNTLFFWRIGSNIDVETVALHEAGHGLSQGHFGKLFRTDANGKFHFAPLAVMNAGYTQVQQNLAPTDLAGHCSIWGNWPNN